MEGLWRSCSRGGGRTTATHEAARRFESCEDAPDGPRPGGPIALNFAVVAGSDVAREVRLDAGSS